MARPVLRVAEVFRRFGDVYRAGAGAALATAHLRVMTAIEQCRTAALGGHVETCARCGHTRVWYNSCRNRHCPSCQSLARARWVDARTAELLDCEYFHVVFTVPQVVAAIALQNPAVVYRILFRATAETLRTIAADPQHLGAEIGFIAVLHTWDQTLGLHPHLHCVVPGGGLSHDGTRWIACRPGFFLPVPVLSRLFRRLLLRYLEEAFDAARLRFGGALTERRTFVAHLAPARKTEWVVYAKLPFGGPQQVLDYVGRYTHRVAISDDHGHVRFRYRNSRAGQPAVATAKLSAPEFIRRFLLHVLPTGFHRIRYYGLFGNRHRTAKLARCRQLLGMSPPRPIAAATDYRDRHEALTDESLRTCPICGDGHMKVVETVPRAYTRPALIDTS